MEILQCLSSLRGGEREEGEGEGGGGVMVTSLLHMPTPTKYCNYSIVGMFRGYKC